MKSKWVSSSIVSVALMLMVGCVPEKRVVWTTDGKMAAVATNSAVQLIDADGNLLPGKVDADGARCAWTHDGQRLVVIHRIQAVDWKAVSDVLTEEQRKKVAELAAVLKPRILEFAGDWKDFKLASDEVSGGIQAAILIYLRDEMPEGLPEKLGDKWPEVRDAKPNVWHMDVFERQADALLPSGTLIRSLDEIVFPMVSPDDAFVDFNMAVWDQGEPGSGLFVVSLKGGAARLVDGNVSLNSDWSADGQRLVYIRCTGRRSGDEVLQLGSLTTVRVRGPDGSPLAEWEEADDRVGLLFNPVNAVRWLRDGRILFSSADVTLPATRRDMPKRWTIFAFDPRMPAGVLNVLGRDFDAPLEGNITLFELSPDEKRILLPCGGGQVAVYEIATGETKYVVDDNELGKETVILPSWRGNDEVCFAMPAPDASAEKKKNLNIMLWKDGKSRSISDAWPEEVKKGWLTD